MSRQRSIYRFVCFTTIFVVSVSLAQAAVLHQYDFEPASSAVTEAGWTHIDLSILATGSTAGFVSVPMNYGPADRGTSTQSPIDVTRDLIIFRNGGTTANPGMVFRDIVPAFASSVLITIYGSDPGDTFGSGSVTATASLNSGSETTIGTGSGFGFYHTSIIYSLPITPAGSTGFLDIREYSTIADSSDMRVNGISFEYTIQEAPEPSTFSLAILGLCALWRVRRK